MPISRLSTSKFWAASQQVTDVNTAIDQYNETPTGIHLDIILRMINRYPRVSWTSKAGEIVRLEIAINSERRASAGQSKNVGAGILGPRGVVNLNPTTWIERLDPGAPSLDGAYVNVTNKQGGQGNIWPVVLLDGKKLIAKTARGHDKGSVETEVEREYRVYKKFHETVGGHPNLVKVWGWADIKLATMHEPGFLMDHIEGPDGRRMQAHLKEAWDLGIVSTAEYWSSIQYIGRCHVKVIQHLRNAGWAHNDIKPENYVVDSTSGEAIVIDLGGAGLLGAEWKAMTLEYSAPEMLLDGKANPAAKGAVASDVFSLGASIAHAAEAPHAFHALAKPNRGLTSNSAHQKNPFEYGAETDYTRQLKRMMNENPLEREKTLDEFDGHSSNRFLNDSILNDQQTREVMKGIASGSRKKNWEEKWRRAGKIPPTVTTVDRTSLEGQLKNKLRPLLGADRFVVGSNMTKEKAMLEQIDLNRKKKEIEEIAKLINQANAFRINTKKATAIVTERLKDFQIAERAINAVLAAPLFPTPPSRR